MNFSVEAKYPIQIFKDNNVSCSWATIKVGWDLNRLTKDEVGKFALEYLEQHSESSNEFISELILGVKKDEVETYLKRVFELLGLKEPRKHTSLWNLEWLKWRYCIMCEMTKFILDDEDLLTHIEGVYADFGYPEDMSEFIYYIPSENNLNKEVGLDPKKARSNLVKKLKRFLEDERIKISQSLCCDKLPARTLNEK